MSPKLFKLALNIYGPFLGSAIKIHSISEDWLHIKVGMKLRFYNRNIHRTHFGGSLYSMTDPHIVLMLMQRLGKDYVVWDREATISFIKPGRGFVYSEIVIREEELEEIIENTQDGTPLLKEFVVRVLGDEEELVAEVKKTIYIRKKAKKH